MPKAAMDYSKTNIYKIVCNDLTIKDCYVGHTTDMTKRKCCHKSNCNNEKSKYHNYKIYQIIRENGGWENWNMVLVEEFPCEDKYQACKRERDVYEELGAKLNTYRPYATQEDNKEKCKEYREKHKQYYQEYRVEHRAEIKEKRKEKDEKRKEKVECEYCAKLLSNSSMSYHIKICKSKPVKE